MAFLDDVTKLGRGAGQGLLDIINAITSPVAPILKEVEKAGAQYAAMQGNPIPMQQLQQQQNRELLGQLMQQQQMQPQAQGPAFQLQKTPQLEKAAQSGDINAFNTEAQRQQNLQSVISQFENFPGVSSENRKVLVNFAKSGVRPDALLQMAVSMSAKTEAQKQAEAKTAQAEQKQIRTEERKAQALEAKSLPNLAKQFAESKPDATEADWLGWLALNKVDPKRAPEVLKGLQATGIYKAQPGFFDRVSKAFGEMFSGKPRPTPQSAAQPQGQIMVSLSTGRRFMKNPDGSLTELK